jgi:hypothetical protein
MTFTSTIYIANSGNTANPGTLAQPKALLSDATTALAAGVQVLFKCGDRWQLGNGTTGWGVTGKVLSREGKLGYYGDVESPHKPLFDAGTYLDASDDVNWTHTGSGVWSRTMTAMCYRLFTAQTVAGVTAGNWGVPLKIKNDVSTVGSYHCDGTTFLLRVNTGSTSVAPPSYYGGIMVIGNGRSTAEGIHLLRCQNVTLEGLRFAHASNVVSYGCQGTNDSVGIRMVEVDSYAPSRTGSAFRGYNTTAAGFWTRDSQLIRCIADNKTQASEDDDASTNWGSQNGINHSGQCRGIQIVDPIVKGFRHTEIQAQCDGTTTRYIGSGLHIYRTRSDMGYTDSATTEYSHPFDIDFDGYLIDGIECRNHVSRAQFGGQGIIRGVKFTGGRQNVQTGNSNTDQCIWLQNWTSPDYRNVTKVLIDSCVFDQPYGEPISLLEDRTAAGVSASAGFASGAVTVQNCLFIDTKVGPSRTYTIRHEVQGSPFSAPGTLTVKNCAFVGSRTAPIRHEETTGVHTSRDVNVTAGSLVASSNLRAASVALAGLDATSYRPVQGGVADGTGAHLGYRRDFDGKLYYNPPCIGPAERVR